MHENWTYFFKKWAIPSLFLIYFRLFKQTINWSCFSEHPNESILFHYNMGSYATLKFLVDFGCVMTCKPLETNFFSLEWTKSTIFWSFQLQARTESLHN